MSEQKASDSFDDRDVLYALGRILASDSIGRGSRAPALLHYVVTEELAGRGERLKAYTIGTDVCGKPEDFDPQADSSVRVEMGRLRKALVDFYQSADAAGLVQIEIPVGTYRPQFSDVPHRRRFAFSERLPSSWPNKQAAIGLCVFLLFAAAGALFSLWPPTPMTEPLGAPFAGTRLAIAPFSTVGVDDDHKHMASALSAELVSKLSATEWLAVFRATYDEHEKNSGPAPDFWIMGTLVRRPGGPELILHLYRHNSDRILDAELVILERGALQSAQIDPEVSDSIVATIARVLGDENAAQATVAKPPAKPSATQYCHYPLHDLRDRLDAKARDILRECALAAIAKYPESADDWAMLAQVYLADYINAGRREVDLIHKAWQAASHAYGLDEHHPDALQARYAVALEGPNRSLKTFFAAGDAVIRLRPNDPDILADYANKLALFSDHHDRAAVISNRALLLNTSPPDWYWWAPTIIALASGRHAEAYNLAQKAGAETGMWVQWVKLASAARFERANEALRSVEVLRALGRETAGALIADIEAGGLAPRVADALNDGARRAFDMAAGASAEADLQAQDARPLRPVVFVPRSDDVDPSLRPVLDYLRLIISSFNSANMHEAPLSKTAYGRRHWPEEYALRLRRNRLAGAVQTELVHLATSAIIMSITLPDIDSATAFDQARDDYADMAIRTFSARGQLISHYIKQGDISDEMRCIAKVYIFFQTQQADDFAAPYKCSNELAQHRVTDPAIYMNQAVLFYALYLQASDDEADSFLDRALERALYANETAPGHRMGNAILSWLYHLLDNPERARQQANLALAGGLVDPDVIALATRAECLYGDAALCLKRMEMVQGHGLTASPWQEFQRLIAYYRLEHMSEAMHQARLVASDRNPMVIATRAAIASRAGDQLMARQLVKELLDVMPNAGDVILRTLTRRNVNEELALTFMADLAKAGLATKP